MNVPQIMETVLRYVPTQMEATSVPAEVVIYWMAIAWHATVKERYNNG